MKSFWKKPLLFVARKLVGAWTWATAPISDRLFDKRAEKITLKWGMMILNHEDEE